jgi:hypothetical protein
MPAELFSQMVNMYDLEVVCEWLVLEMLEYCDALVGVGVEEEAVEVLPLMSTLFPYSYNSSNNNMEMVVAAAVEALMQRLMDCCRYYSEPIILYALVYHFHRQFAESYVLAVPEQA